jgi:multiple antibiotic resistance protein
VILLVALFVGRGVLAMLSISIGAFTTAGGIIIFLVSLKMVLGETKRAKSNDQSNDVGQGFALVPLATPLLAGPGAISSVIVYASKGATDRGTSLVNDAILSAIIVLVGLATWAALGAADRLRRVLGETGIEVCTRIAGILVAAIAVQMMHDGLVRLFPQLVQ